MSLILRKWKRPKELYLFMYPGKSIFIMQSCWLQRNKSNCMYLQDSGQSGGLAKPSYLSKKKKKKKTNVKPSF